MRLLILGFVVLVGAFSDFRQLDTGNPVQIYGVFADFALIRKL